ncbi:YihY/virulence factor BrkB family protein [Paenalkalicoccus suaedae]|uniref:YihY/virulence factor BrkB family protein n=1 Tax=Paenalkalicoccus suaedae TaxID=2592382 RepID=A0A859FG54_9BACI|nr:YihY/virulence factor BrkB family protein [Paenalkalicoccus suaedae]QKS71185.1 YihY/virulence factor BrkB family protein [Paenalkalicoccus suaedae]
MFHTLKVYVKEIMNEWANDNPPLLAAAQAYYYILAILPLIVLLLAILPYLNLDVEQVLSLMDELLPREVVSTIDETIIDVISTPNGGLLTVGIIGTIWSASNGVNAFIMAVNEAYNFTTKRSFLVHRGLSIGLTLLLILTILTTLLLPILGDTIISIIGQVMPMPSHIELFLQVIRWFIALFVMLAVLSVLYFVAPNAKVPFKQVLPGAMFATAAWLIISWGFAMYVSNFGSYSATYGSLGGVVILMLWFFLTGVIFVLGAEINAIYYRRHGRVRKFRDEKS